MPTGSCHEQVNELRIFPRVDRDLADTEATYYAVVIWGHCPGSRRLLGREESPQVLFVVGKSMLEFVKGMVFLGHYQQVVRTSREACGIDWVPKLVADHEHMHAHHDHNVPMSPTAALFEFTHDLYSDRR